MSSISVRLLVYSGRPDPEWELTGSSVDQLAEKIRPSLRDAAAEPRAAGGLGYRGFLLRLEGVDDLPSELAVFASVISEGPKRAWRDSSGLEQTLLADARERGYGEVLDALRAGPATAGPAAST